MAFQDIEPEETSSFRDASFVDTITEILFVPKTIGEDIVEMVSFGFENGAPLDFFEPEDWTNIKDFAGIGRVIADLRKTGIKFQVDPESRQMRTVPSIIGAKVSFKCTKQEKTVKGIAKTYTNWNIENIQLPEGKGTAQNEDTHKTDDKELIATCQKNIETILTGHPCSMRDIIKGFSNIEPDREKRLPQLKIKESVLEDLIAEGLVELKGDVYHLL